MVPFPFTYESITHIISLEHQHSPLPHTKPRAFTSPVLNTGLVKALFNKRNKLLRNTL